MPAESRNEAILQAMLDGTSSSELEPPQSRIETLLQAVLDKMNEGGGVGPAAGLVVTCSTNGVLNKTWKEIHDAMAAGQNVTISIPEEYGGFQEELIPCQYCSVDETQFKPYAVGGGSHEFNAATSSDYPS